MIIPEAFIDQWEFPSPCGERVLLNLYKGCSKDHYMLAVSVPLRGKGSVERLELFTTLTGADYPEVSVPLRGKGSVEPGEGNAVIEFSVTFVSVPLRGKGSVEPATKGQKLPSSPLSFRPLAGKGFC